MKKGGIPDLILDADCETAVAQVTFHLSREDFHVVRSFDLFSACATVMEGVCPHSGMAPCACQLAVLLVYGRARLPVSLVLRQHGWQTELCLMGAEWPPLAGVTPDGAELERGVQKALMSLADRWAQNDSSASRLRAKVNSRRQTRDSRTAAQKDRR